MRFLVSGPFSLEDIPAPLFSLSVQLCGTRRVLPLAIDNRLFITVNSRLCLNRQALSKIRI
jgi:hypothetical protein